MNLSLVALAAFACVLRIGRYSIPQDTRAIFGAVHCVLAAWGRSDLARQLMLRTPLQMTRDAQRILFAVSTPNVVASLMAQPFISTRWTLPANAAFAVRCVAHDWEAGNIQSIGDFVDVAARHCASLGRLIASDAKLDVVQLQIIGAALADSLSPHGGSTSTSLSLSTPTTTTTTTTTTMTTRRTTRRKCN